ncbi:MULTISPECIES: ABC transporter ATP-binding protein [Paenibacillus]|uniref:ABC transporter ATP-binding protein n=1 Tax=Paenibacillus TaxID=44249 RepID=UPI0022B86594|nr:ABC transporter ATP-binding protein [Paenibacillus caseinilyticus]MCZ8519186.1 ABC transporter ATP-binding protein [Paenibacillus caseinilyticus]
MQDEIANGGSVRVPEPRETAAAVRGLRLKFPGSAPLLFEDLTLEVPRGQKVLLLGPSGCGKSTLLQVFSGLIPQSIEVPMKADSLLIPEAWGYLFQDPETQFCMPFVDEELAFVLENLRVPREEMEERIRIYLKRVGLHLEDIHVPIASLSGGMKQRLAIASLLALEPDVWFLDEPTSLLDPEGTGEVWETVKELTRDKTVLIVEHKIEELAGFVDRVVLFGPDARILADGPPQTVFREHRSELREYGIWYPGVWEDYDLQPGRLPGQGVSAFRGAAGVQPLASLREFRGFHGREQKIQVPAADVFADDWIAIVGENGAGKSTLLQALMQLIPTQGGYTLGTCSVRGFDEVRDEASYVFQNPELQFVTHSVFDEVAWAYRQEGLPEAEVRAQSEELLKWYGLEQQGDLHPYQLSLGQKRRLSVASATGKARRLLLLDEPTFGQDAANTFALLEKLEEWRRGGSAIVMVTHDPEIVARFATRVWEVRGGALTAEISPEAYRASHSVRRSAGKETEPLCR